MGGLILAERRAYLEAAVAAAIEALDALDGDADFEPATGAPEPTTAANLDQRHWAQGGDCSEREILTGDDEPDDHHVVSTHPDEHDQRRIIDWFGRIVDA